MVFGTKMTKNQIAMQCRKRRMRLKYKEGEINNAFMQQKTLYWKNVIHRVFEITTRKLQFDRGAACNFESFGTLNICRCQKDMSHSRNLPELKEIHAVSLFRPSGPNFDHLLQCILSMKYFSSD